jgi:hypothetical protein
VQDDADSVLIVLTNAALLGANDTSEIAEMIDGQGQIGSASFADGFAVVDRLGHCQQLQVLLYAVSDLVKDGTEIHLLNVEKNK